MDGLQAIHPTPPIYNKMKALINTAITAGLLLITSTVAYAQKAEDNGSLSISKIPESFEVQRDLVHKTVDGQKLTFY